MNQKVAKSGSKFLVGTAVALVLGMIVKLESHIDDKIDDHYDRKSKKS